MPLPLLADFTKIGGGNKELGLNSQAYDRNPSMKGAIADSLRMPETCTPETVKDWAKKSAIATTQAQLAKQESKFRLKTARAQASIHQTRTLHSVQGMQINQQVEASDLQYQQSLLANAHQTGVNQATLSGYQQALASNRFSLFN